LIKLGVWAVYGVADAVARVAACVFRQEDICTVLVNKIVFFAGTWPRCIWTEVYLDVVDVPLG